jgi:hypothetical protein
MNSVERQYELVCRGWPPNATVAMAPGCDQPLLAAPSNQASANACAVAIDHSDQGKNCFSYSTSPPLGGRLKS